MATLSAPTTSSMESAISETTRIERVRPWLRDSVLLRLGCGFAETIGGAGNENSFRNISHAMGLHCRKTAF